MPVNRIGRILLSSDFEAVLARAPAALSPHFAVHALVSVNGTLDLPGTAIESIELSTGLEQVSHRPVDKRGKQAQRVTPRPEHCLGIVVPKRLARRSVTRSAMKRNVREGFANHRGDLPPGLWVVRLRSAFSGAAYPSATSSTLKCVVRNELAGLLRAAAEKTRTCVGR